MRLLILTQYYPPEIGAPQSRLTELAAGFRDLGWDIGVVTAMPNYPTGKIFEEYRGKIRCTGNIDGIPLKRFWAYPSNSPRTLPRIFSMLSFAVTSLFSLPYVRKFKPDYIFAESPPLTLAFSGWLLANLTGGKLIMNVSDLWPLTAKELGAIDTGFLYRCIEALEKFLYRRAFICTGQSQEIVDHIAKNKPKRVFLFRNGVDSSRFSTPRRNGDGNQNRLVYAGLLGVAQGILAICKNVRFRDLGAEFHIYGTGPEREKIEEFLLESPDSGIFLHPTVSRNQIPTTLSGYDGTLIPLTRRIYGAVPSKIYEAMAAGLPILFSGDGEGARIISEHKVGWVSQTNDFKHLAQNIHEFLSKPEKRNSYASNGIKSAKQVFERGIQIRQLDSYLRSCISESK